MSPETKVILVIWLQATCRDAGMTHNTAVNSVTKNACTCTFRWSSNAAAAAGSETTAAVVGVLSEQLARLRCPELGGGRLVLDRVAEPPQDGGDPSDHHVVIRQLQHRISLLGKKNKNGQTGAGR